MASATHSLSDTREPLFCTTSSSHSFCLIFLLFFFPFLPCLTTSIQGPGRPFYQRLRFINDPIKAVRHQTKVGILLSRPSKAAMPGSIPCVDSKIAHLRVVSLQNQELAINPVGWVSDNATRWNLKGVPAELGFCLHFSSACPGVPDEPRLREDDDFLYADIS